MSLRKRQYRKRKVGKQEDEGNDKRNASTSERLQETLVLQRRRKRRVGLDTEALTTGDKPKDLDVEDGTGPLEEGATETLQAYVKAKAMRAGGENEHMDRYVEAAMAERLGRGRMKGDSGSDGEGLTEQEKREAELYEIPGSLKGHGTPNVVIPGLMTGITEVQLPIDVRLQNIEETEEAKKKLLETSTMGKDPPRPEEEDLPQTFRDTFELKRTMFAPSFGRPVGTTGASDDIVASRFIQREKERLGWKRR